MWKPRHATICYRPSATVPVTFLSLRIVVAAALVAGGAQAPSLGDAILYGQTAVVQQLIAAGADVNAADDTGMTPLMIAASQGHTAIARLLIAAHASVDAAGPDPTTALMPAASANRAETAKLLIARGANVNARNNGGKTALMVAALGGGAEAVRAVL